jgi:hypothetical protein
MNQRSNRDKLVEIMAKSIWTYGKDSKSSARAITLSITSIVMNSIVSCGNLPKTGGRDFLIDRKLPNCVAMEVRYSIGLESKSREKGRLPNIFGSLNKQVNL